jgi:hypothetical protein
MKSGLGALGTAENESGSAKHEKGTKRHRYCRKLVRERKTRKRDSAPSEPPIMSLRAQNMKTGLDTSVPTKMSTGVQNMKIGPDDLGTVEIGISRPQYR